MYFLSGRVREQTYPNLFVFSASGQVLSIRAEADTADIKIAVFVDTLVLQSRNVVTSGHIKNLRGAVTARSQVLAVTTETNTADNTVMNEMVHQIHVKHTLNLRVKNRVPVIALTFLRGRKVIGVPVSQHVTWALPKHGLARRSRTWDLRRRARVRVSKLVRLLRGSWTRRSARSFGSRRGRRRRRGPIAYNEIDCQRQTNPKDTLTTYHSQQHRAGVPHWSPVAVVALLVEPQEQAAERYVAAGAAFLERGEGQDWEHYLLGWP